ncbi:hypothetical protein EJB05_27658, partial [Eragrostis curvula]
MEAKKPYVIAIVIQMIYTGMFVVSKAAFDHGMNTFVFIFYRQAASSLLLLPIAVLLERKNSPPVSFQLLLKLFLCAIIGSTFTLNAINASMKFTSATVASASYNGVPVVTFCIALLLSVCVQPATYGLLIHGIREGGCEAEEPLRHSKAYRGSALSRGRLWRMAWIKGTFLMVLAMLSFSLWIVIQAGLLKEYPNKMLVTLSQCVFSTVQSFAVAIVVERDFSEWKA